jgi:hypothetical protein
MPLALKNRFRAATGRVDGAAREAWLAEHFAWTASTQRHGVI